jgi:hypothetical protein
MDDPIGPTPGIVAMRLLTSSSRCHFITPQYVKAYVKREMARDLFRLQAEEYAAVEARLARIEATAVSASRDDPLLRAASAGSRRHRVRRQFASLGAPAAVVWS